MLDSRSCEEALAQAVAAKNGVEILVTDTVLGGRNGPDMADRLLELFPGVKVLFVSGQAAVGVLFRDFRKCARSRRRRTSLRRNQRRRVPALSPERLRPRRPPGPRPPDHVKRETIILRRYSRSIPF